MAEVQLICQNCQTLHNSYQLCCRRCGKYLTDQDEAGPPPFVVMMFVVALAVLGFGGYKYFIEGSKPAAKTKTTSSTETKRSKSKRTSRKRGQNSQ